MLESLLLCVRQYLCTCQLKSERALSPDCASMRSEPPHIGRINTKSNPLLWWPTGWYWISHLLQEVHETPGDASLSCSETAHWALEQLKRKGKDEQFCNDSGQDGLDYADFASFRSSPESCGILQAKKRKKAHIANDWRKAVQCPEWKICLVDGAFDWSQMVLSLNLSHICVQVVAKWAKGYLFEL